MAVDKKKHVFLVLLDLSAAFDTVDHEILLDFLIGHVGLSGSVFHMLATYIPKTVHSEYPFTMFFPLCHSLFLLFCLFWGLSFSVCTLFLTVLHYGPTNVCTIYTTMTPSCTVLVMLTSLLMLMLLFCWSLWSMIVTKFNLFFSVVRLTPR